jgi:hypothetical protein
MLKPYETSIPVEQRYKLSPEMRARVDQDPLVIYFKEAIARTDAL